jgi:signal transduction histidine kinase
MEIKKMIDSQSLKKLKRSELELLILQLNESFLEEQRLLQFEIEKNSQLLEANLGKDVNELISKFIKDLCLRETSTIRVVYLKNNYFYEKIFFSSGKNSTDYGILDDQVIKQIGDKDHLVIQDTSRIHNIKFSKEHAYPRSLMAFPILRNNEKVGVVWIGDQKYQAFSKIELENYKKIIALYNDALTVFAVSKILDQERVVYKQVVAKDNLPIIIFNTKQKIIFANELAIDQFDLSFNERDECFSNNYDFSTLFNSSKRLENPTIEYKDKEFTVIESLIPDSPEGKTICLKFIDRSYEVEKGKYFNTIISTITHYLKSPLVEIKKLATLISSIGDLSEKQNEFLLKMKNNVDEIQGSVTQLISVNKINQGDFVEINKISINETLENVAKILFPLTQQKQITLNVHKSDDDQMINDKTLLKHVLLNVLEFSIKETHMGGTIKIIHKKDLDNQSISVADSGKGISNFDVKKLLDKKDMDQERNELEITRDIMAILNGKLSIESNLGSGTTITLVFPRK